MKILEQIKKANDRLIKHIEQSIDLLEVDQEKTTSQSFYMFVDDLSYVLQIIKHRDKYLYDFTLTNVVGKFRACFKFNEYTGKVNIIRIYENNILGNKNHES